MITDTRTIPQSAVRQTFFWLEQFSRDWRGEVPIKLHEGHGGLGAAPAFTSEFNNYIGKLKCSSPHCHSCRCINPSCQRCASRRSEDRGRWDLAPQLGPSNTDHPGLSEAPGACST